ncbi:membrane protein insertase YidC [Jatrophihabitans sp. YIM 134969]
MLDFLYYAVSWVLLRWHDLMNLIGLDPAGGVNWVLSIVLLVVTARLLLFRLFIKQVHYQRKMQEMQPRLSAIREKYKNDKAAQQREMMALQQQEGFNPLAGCLPLVAQLPVFIGLLHVLRHLATSSLPNYPTSQLTLYGFSAQQTTDAGRATFFTAPISAQFQNTNNIIERLGGDVSTTRIVITVLLLVSAAATFITQRQVMARATTTPEGTQALVQKAMLYLIPLGVLASGFVFNFPLGVLIYWFTSNLWTMAQQFYINKFHPNTPAEAAAAAAAAGAGQTGKALAPKPGQKPNRNRTAPPAGAPNLTKDEPTAAEPAADAGASAKRSAAGRTGQASTRGGGTARTSPGSNGASASAAPRPGQKPAPGRKPGQAKKRR